MKQSLPKKLYYKAKATNLKDYFLVEVKTVGEPRKVQFGRKDVVIKPVKGDGELRVNYESLIVK